MTKSYARGAYLTEGDLSLPYLWTSLHLNAELASTSERDAWDPREAQRFSDQVRFLCAELKPVDATRWMALCDAAGPTVMGAAALSWCSGATLPLVCQYWRASGYDLHADPDRIRPARALNPAILPESVSLTEIVDSCADELAICLTLAATEGPIEYDIPAGTLFKAKPMLSRFLLHRLSDASLSLPEKDALIVAWISTASRVTEGHYP